MALVLAVGLASASTVAAQNDCTTCPVVWVSGSCSGNRTILLCERWIDTTTGLPPHSGCQRCQEHTVSVPGGFNGGTWTCATPGSGSYEYRAWAVDITNIPGSPITCSGTSGGCHVGQCFNANCLLDCDQAATWQYCAVTLP